MQIACASLLVQDECWGKEETKLRCYTRCSQGLEVACKGMIACDMENGTAGPIQGRFGQVAILDQPTLLVCVHIVQAKEALEIIFRAHRASMVAFPKHCC